MGMYYRAVTVDSSQLDRLRSESAFASDVLDANPELDLDKNFMVVQVLLTGSMDSNEPLMTGVSVGENLGYGPPYLATPNDVERVSSMLGDPTEAELASRVDEALFDELDLYPGSWDEDPEFVQHAVRDALSFIAFYQSAAASGRGVLAGLR